MNFNFKRVSRKLLYAAVYGVVGVLAHQAITRYIDNEWIRWGAAGVAATMGITVPFALKVSEKVNVTQGTA